MKTINHPCSVAGWRVFEYADKSHSSLFYWESADRISSDMGYETAILADAGAIEEYRDTNNQLGASIMKNFELVVAGFNAETDDTDDLVIWVAAESKAEVARFIADNDLASTLSMGSDLPDGLSEDDGIEFQLPDQAEGLVAHVKSLLA